MWMFREFHLCKVQRSHDFIGKPSPICWNTGAMGIFWSHEFIGTEWDFKHFNFNRDTLPRHFWRFSELPKVGLPNDEWIRRQDSVIATSGSTGGSSLRGLAAERDRLQRQAPEWRWGILRHDKMCCFFSSPKKRIWADVFFEGCHTAMLPCFFLLFSSFFWVLVLHFGTWKSCSMGATWGTRDAHRCLQCSTGRGILESEFLWKDHRGRDFWCFGAKLSLGWFQRLLITYTSGKWLPKDRLQYNFCGGLSWTTSNTPNPEFAWHPQNSLCFNAFLPHWLQQKGRSIRRRSHISWPHHGCLYPGFVHAAPTAKGADGWIAPRTEIVIVAVVAICFCRYCCCCYLFSVFSFLLLLL